MRDRGLSPFASLDGPSEPQEFLSLVAAHYSDPKPIIRDLGTQRLVLEELWHSMSLAHLSIDVLAYVWENTLVTDDLR